MVDWLYIFPCGIEGMWDGMWDGMTRSGAKTKAPGMLIHYDQIWGNTDCLAVSYTVSLYSIPHYPMVVLYDRKQ